MSRRFATAVPLFAVLFLAGWLASLVIAPACTASPPKFDLNYLWASLIEPFVLWSLMVRIWPMARPISGTALRVRWPVLAVLLLSVGIVGCALSLGCAQLDARWPTWGEDDAFRLFMSLQSLWKMAGLAGMCFGLLGLLVARFPLPSGSPTP